MNIDNRDKFFLSTDQTGHVLFDQLLIGYNTDQYASSLSTDQSGQVFLSTDQRDKFLLSTDQRDKFLLSTDQRGKFCLSTDQRGKFFWSTEKSPAQVLIPLGSKI
ncbi:hypothetical protein CEXT_766011 [Caerostris extrusa]|uniref:Uncharacterized protein n=1 Tax=Caerostris extrusa TaxID=172846 RepID=A0AAV4N5Z0_CAEEX|nr:hypothetical protein CEXT_766011 [Caerostris extrusa]